MNRPLIRTTLALALAATALVGCKKTGEDPTGAEPDNTATAPAATTPEPAMTPTPAPTTTPDATTGVGAAGGAGAPMTGTGFTVGNAAAADRTVTAMTTFSAQDDIVVSVRTDAAVPTDATLDAKLTYQDGQVAGQKTQTIRAEDAGVTNIEFTNTNAWPAGTYRVDVTMNGQPVGTTQTITVQ